MKIFKDPIPPSKWTNIYDATEEKPGCFAMDSYYKKVIGSEDCLNLNIYTKDLRPKQPYPVNNIFSILIFLYICASFLSVNPF